MSISGSGDQNAAWRLWSNDYFDMDAPPFLEMEGEGILAGLAVLWEKTLQEGVQDNGRPTFTGFALESRQGRFSLPRDPSMNSGLARLRMWLDHADLLDTLARASLAGDERIAMILKTAAESSSPDNLCDMLRQMDAGSIPVAPVPETGSLCDSCATMSVVSVREDPPGFRLFRCGKCHEVKRLCPHCGQGWLVHYVVDESPRSRYACDECRTVWDSRWNCLTPEGVPYVASKVLGTNPVQTRDYEKAV